MRVPPKVRVPFEVLVFRALMGSTGSWHPLSSRWVGFDALVCGQMSRERGECHQLLRSGGAVSSTHSNRGDRDGGVKRTEDGRGDGGEEKCVKVNSPRNTSKDFGRQSYRRSVSMIWGYEHDQRNSHTSLQLIGHVSRFAAFLFSCPRECGPANQTESRYFSYRSA